MMYLIVKCDELGDQWECDANRIPICLTNDYSKYNTRGYEVYKVKADNTFELIRNYDDISCTEIVICIWNDAENVEEKDPDKIITIKKGNRNDVSKSLIKKIKQQYKFTDSVDDIYRSIYCTGDYGEESIDGKWIAFGEKLDDIVPKGF